VIIEIIVSERYERILVYGAVCNFRLLAGVPLSKFTPVCHNFDLRLKNHEAFDDKFFMKLCIFLSLILLSVNCFSQGLGTGGERDWAGESCQNRLNGLAKLERKYLKKSKLQYQGHERFVAQLAVEMTSGLLVLLPGEGKNSEQEGSCVLVRSPKADSKKNTAKETILRSIERIYIADLETEKKCLPSQDFAGELSLLRAVIKLHEK
jgi:hypothetical protein